MRWAVFYQRDRDDSTIAVDQLVLDATHSLRYAREVSAKECRRRGYDGFAILRGRTLARSYKIHPLTQQRYERVRNEEVEVKK